MGPWLQPPTHFSSLPHSIHNALTERQSPLHSFLCWFLSSIGIAELEFALLNILASFEIYADVTADTLSQLQVEVTSFSQIAI